MTLEILIRLQKQFNEPLLAPLCDRYIFYFERYLNKGYKKNSKTMALYKVKKELVKKYTKQKKCN